YNWYAVDDACGLCPDGWRVPSDNDYKTLEIYLGMDPTEADGEGWRGTDQGSQLADGYDLWTNGTLRNNSQFGTSDFMALPAGLRDEDGFYVDMSSIIFFWTSSEQSSVQAWQRALYYANSGLGRDNYSKIFGLSVRCIRE
ncbi:MAG: fibrobacter succinogenes major paralogous domain-containing protein, partial [Candidatus Zixiibacteriota bacterium]